jgi:hypothetical protein
MELPEEKYSYRVRRIVAEERARASFDEVVEFLKKQSGAEVPKRQVEELAVRAARDFEPGGWRRRVRGRGGSCDWKGWYRNLLLRDDNAIAGQKIE